MRPRPLPPIILIILLAVLASAAGPAAAQAPASAATRVATILLEFPAPSSSVRDAAAARLLALGPEAVADLCARLAAPGDADDSLARYALDAMAVRASRPGAEAERLAFVKELLKALDDPRDPENTDFLIEVLRRTAKGEAVSALSRFLKDDRLSGPAVRALVAGRSPASETALVKALAGAASGPALSIINGLGELRARAAVKPLIALSGGRDPVLRAAALDALADIGDPAAIPVLERVSVAAPAAERERAVGRLLLFARRAAELGNRGEAESIARSFLRFYTAPGEDQARASALDLLFEIKGDAVAGDLLAAAVSPDKELRQKALALAARITDGWSAPAWIGLLGRTPPDVQADVIRMLGGRGEKAALEPVLALFGSDRREVRVAAVEAAARLGGEGVLENVLPLFRSGDAAETAAAKAALLSFGSVQVVPRAAALLAEVPPLGKIALLEVLAERQASDQAEAVLALARNGDDKVRAAAMAALEQVARAADVPALVGLLAGSAVSSETLLLQNAVVAAALRDPDGSRRADAVLVALPASSGPKRVDLIRPLARIGGDKALDAVLAETSSADPQVRSVALFTLSNWVDDSAVPALSGIAQAAADRKSRSLAIQGISRLVAASEAAPTERLAALDRAMGFAVEPDEKGAVLAALASVRSPEALARAAKALDEPVLQARAAQTVLRLVLPSAGWPGLKGFETAAAIKKALPFAENAYDREQAERYAGDLLLEAGFTALFNGKDLSGWKGLVADPPARAAMPVEDMAAARTEADAFMRAHWRVVEGVLAFDGRGHSLCTKRDYGDFEMFVDWKIEPKGDSGIYLRGSPQIQIWDPAQAPEGSGGLYNNQKNPSKPLVRADRPVGEWNTFYIRMKDERVTVRLNGALVTDDVPMENYWERDKPIYPTGQIELQAHSTPLHFKNIFLRELPGGEEIQGPSNAEKAEGFVPLFNGRDLAGWTGGLAGYRVENGAIAALPEGTGNLYTEKEYSDFDLRFEFKLTPGANNGIGLRAPLEGDAAYVGMEIQVLDDTADQYKDLKPYQYHGSVYGIVPAKRGSQRPVGEWNTEEIVLRGRRITVRVNGTTIVEADLDAASTPRTMDGRDHPGLGRASGHIGFLGHGSRVEYRNLRIKELKSE